MGDDFELDRLRAEIAQEKEMKDMLEQSLGELQVTVDELERRADGVEEESDLDEEGEPEDDCTTSRQLWMEGNEWKTRYETQCELNQQLEKQIIVLQDKVDEGRRTLKDSRAPKSVRQYDEYGEITPHFLKQLEKEKNVLQGQLRDLEWKLDQESKAYHKANEERKTFMTEINATRGAINHIRHTTVHPNVQNSPRPEVNIPTLTPRAIGNVNIAPDQRILDPRKGPIKKTAAVKNLPRLD